MKKIFLIALFSVIILFSLKSCIFAADQDWCSDLSHEQRSGGIVPCGRSCDDPSTSEDETTPCTICHFFIMLQRIVNFLLFDIVPVLAVLMIAIGGFMYITAFANPAGEGSPAMVSKAKSLFSAIVIGLLIIYGAWVIINTFLMLIGVAGWTGLESGWWQINCD
jgi:hypothetical protein